jgi:hypothetical protein
MAIYIWRREAGGHRARVDAPLLGILLSLTSRVPLYLLLGHHFLLSTKTLAQILLTDTFAGAAAMFVISKMEPKRPSFYPGPAGHSSLFGLLRDKSKAEMLFYALGLSTLLTALYSYIAERQFMQALIRSNVLEHSIPAYLSSLKPAFAEAIAHPTIAVPVLRSSATPMSMPAHLLHSLALPICLAILGIVYLPQKSPEGLAGLAFLLTAPSNALAVFNLLPVTRKASAAIGLDHGFKAALAAYLVSWATEEWRRPNLVRKAQGLLKDVTQNVQEEVIVEKDSITFRERVDPLPEGALIDDTQEVELVE